MEKVVSLCKRRGFIYPGSEIYGGLSNSWDYGPLGVELKNNIKRLWWESFVHRRTDMFGIDAALLMNTRVWEASGHLEKFCDPLSECKRCKNRFRPDTLKDPKICPMCGGILSEPRLFHTMMKTFLGPVEEAAALAYFRPETAQGMFVNFKNIVNSFHPKLPFGIAQIGKAFRNEITPGNFIFRTREFEQMEIEYFFAPPKNDQEWQECFEGWLDAMKQWLKLIGVSLEHIFFHELPDTDRAFYSKRTIDLEYQFPFGQDELYGLAYRTDYDLSQHQKHSGKDLCFIADGGERILPHVVEPTFGVDRTVLAVLLESYREEEERVVLSLPSYLAPFQAAVFPLLANKETLTKEAHQVYDLLRQSFHIAFDDIGNIGKRYRRQDEIGTPFCFTIDFETLENHTVTVRDRDTMKQERVAIDQLTVYLRERTSFPLVPLRGV